MKRIILLLTIILLTINVTGQDRHKIDSLNNELRKFEIHKKQIGSKATSMMDSTKANLYYAIYDVYHGVVPDSAMDYSKRCLKVSETIGYKKGMGMGYSGMGAIANDIGDTKLSLEYHQKALSIRKETGDKKKIIESYLDLAYVSSVILDFPKTIEYQNEVFKLDCEIGDRKGAAFCLNQIGIIYTNQSNYTKGLKYNLDAMKLYEEIKDKDGIGSEYNNIGFIYSQIVNYPEAIKNYLLGIDIYKDIKDSNGLANTYLNLGWVYTKQGNYDEALKNELISLKMGTGLHNQNLIALSDGNIGDIYLQEKKYTEALKNYFNELKAYKENEAIKIPPDVYNSMGNAYEKQGNLNDALKYETKGLAQGLNWKNNLMIVDSYEELTKIYAKMQNFKAAYDNEVLFKQYYDTIFNKDNEKKLTSLQMKYDFDKIQDSTKAEQDKKDLIATNEIKRQKNVRNYTLAGLGIVLLFSIVVFRQRNNIRKGKKRSDELLLNILPEEVAEELKEKGSAEAKMFDDVTVMFTDFKGFTTIAEKLSAKELVGEINYCFSAFDNIIHNYGIEKIKTIGDSYMAVGGLPVANKSHAKDVVNAAIEINKFMEEHKQQRLKEGKEIFEIRIGIHTGPVVAGIVGIKKFAYDIWGDTVNLASRMESSGEAGKINISGSAYESVKNDFTCIYRGKIQAKNKGEVDMYFVREKLTVNN